MTDNNVIKCPINDSEETRDTNQDPGIIVLVPDKQFDYYFWEAVAETGFDVYIFETAQEAEQLLSTRTIDTLYIRSNNSSLYQSLVVRFKRLNQYASVIYYTDIKEILSSNYNSSYKLSLIKDNFKLIQAILAEDNIHSGEHIDDIVKYTELLCDRLQISNDERILSIAAAYVHDFSLTLIDSIEHKHEEDVVRFSSQYLKAINYTSGVSDILDLMYVKIDSEISSIDNFILANILSAADYYTHSKYNKPNLTVEEFKQLTEILRAKIGIDFLPEVGQELINILYDTITITKPTYESCYVIIFNESGADQLMFKDCLENLGFEAEFVSSVDDLMDCHNKRNVDILVLEAKGTVLQVSDLVNKIEDHNINFDNVATYLLTNNENIFELTGLLQKGIEDIISIENDLDPFLIKIIRKKKRLIADSNKQVKMLEKMGTFGSLSDISLMDLLQTMNGNGKTCLISVSAQRNQLTIYVQNGQIIYAEDEEYKGEKAIFKGLEWSKGIWSFDPVNISDLPRPNVNQSINSILLEGCQYLDESKNINTTDEINLDETFNFLD